jgi:hypothetical protein
MPRQLKKKKALKLGKHKAIAKRKQDKYIALTWKDKRMVIMLSTWHNQDKKVPRKSAKEVTSFRSLLLSQITFLEWKE